MSHSTDNSSSASDRPNAPAPLKAGHAVDEARLWDRLMEIAKIGATEKGGVNRQAFSAEDRAAKRLLAQWGQALGLEMYSDTVGNFFLRKPGSDPDAAPVMAGSHLDSQVTGGKFDGTYGVMAALEAVQAIHDAGVDHKKPIEVVAWSNEEGSRFTPGCMGSEVFAGVQPLEAFLDVTDPEGIRMADELAVTLDDMTYASPRDPLIPASYFEAHIEQGPRLEKAGLPVGAVTSIQGSQRFTVEVHGVEGHAGTVPRALRQDALSAAVAMVSALEKHFHDPEDVVRFTVGRFQVMPGTPNTIPSFVHFSIDFRHPDNELLNRLGGAVESVCQAVAGPCRVEVEMVDNNGTIEFPEEQVGAVEGWAKELGLPVMRLPSGAGHDAGHVAHLCPTGMVFIPCEEGVSHNEAESATAPDCAAGARVLAACLVEAANR
ncbi:M20 family metallo-hydrolase [Rhodovibrionaceae bacterium A322]